MAVNPEEFNQILSQYQAIKDQHVKGRLAFYERRVDCKRYAAQAASVAILFLSLAIPIVTNLDFTVLMVRRDVVVSFMSLLIAFITALNNDVFRWQHTWKEYSRASVQIKGLIALWDVQVANARQLSDAHEIAEALGKSTENLLKSVEQAVSAEMETFFSPPSKPPGK